MKIPSFKEIFTEDIKGKLREDIVPLLPTSFFEDPLYFLISREGRIISESKWRWAGIFHLNSNRSIFLKKDSTKDSMELLKYLIFPSKAKKEWLITCQVKKRDLPVPEPLGWFEKHYKALTIESYYISEAIVSGSVLVDCQYILKDEIVLSNLVKTLLKIHRSGLYHKDLHAGNLIWDGQSFFVLDLHRAKIVKSLSLNQRLFNIASLLHSLRDVLKEGDQIKFIEEYFKTEKIDSNVSILFNKIHLLMDNLQNRQWESRTKRCLKESTDFTITKNNHIIVYHRKEFGIDLISKLLKNHLEISSKEQTRLVKKDKKSLISCLKDGETSIYIKQFCYPSLRDKLSGFLFFSKGMRAWVGGNGLRVRGISSITPLGLLVKKHWGLIKEDFLFMEEIKDGLEMDRYISNHLNSLLLKRRFIKEFAHWLSILHQKKIYHKDMKACNIIVTENKGNWDFYLLDLEDVRLKEDVNEKRLLKNLIQLNTSIPEIISERDRLRFFKEYTKFRPLVKEEKSFIRKIIKKGRQRGVVYISSNGIVIKR